MDEEQQDKLRELADQMDIATKRADSYARLLGLINMFLAGSFPDVGKALENFASVAGRDSMSLEERRQACMDAVLRECGEKG